MAFEVELIYSSRSCSSQDKQAMSVSMVGEVIYSIFSYLSFKKILSRWFRHETILRKYRSSKRIFYLNLYFLEG